MQSQSLHNNPEIVMSTDCCSFKEIMFNVTNNNFGPDHWVWIPVLAVGNLNVHSIQYLLTFIWGKDCEKLQRLIVIIRKEDSH